jgi:hypothetical protein
MAPKRKKAQMCPSALVPEDIKPAFKGTNLSSAAQRDTVERTKRVRKSRRKIYECTHCGSVLPKYMLMPVPLNKPQMLLCVTCWFRRRPPREPSSTPNRPLTSARKRLRKKTPNGSGGAHAAARGDVTAGGLDACLPATSQAGSEAGLSATDLAGLDAGLPPVGRV